MFVVQRAFHAGGGPEPSRPRKRIQAARARAPYAHERPNPEPSYRLVPDSQVFSFAAVASVARNAFSLLFLQGYRPFDEQPGNDPDEWKEQHAEDEPGQREPEHARGHQFGEEIVEQRQTKQRD